MTATTKPPTPPTTLAYAPAPHRHRRRMWRRGALAVLLLTAAAAGWRWGPAAWGHATLLYWQRQCLRYDPPPGQVVYEAEPQAAGRLLAGGDGSYAAYVPPALWTVPKPDQRPSPAAAHVPRCWREMNSAVGTGATGGGAVANGGAIIFLGELRAPDGRPYLVAVRYAPERSLPSLVPGFNTEVTVLRPATLTRRPESVPAAVLVSLEIDTMTPRPPPDTRVYAGRVDPADPSHFTIEYEMWGQREVLDGRIDNEGVVRVVTRKPPAAKD